MIEGIPEIWQKGVFFVAREHQPIQSTGHVYRGLGLTLIQPASPKGRRRPVWNLIHLGSGHLIIRIKENVGPAFAIATEIAQAGDWTFDGIHGWKNQFPDVYEKIAVIRDKYPKRFQGGVGNPSTEAAYAVMMAREDA